MNINLDMDLIIIILAGAIIVLMIVILIALLAKRGSGADIEDFEDSLEAHSEEQKAEISQMIGNLDTSNNRAIEQLGNYLGKNQGLAAEMQAKQLDSMGRSINTRLEDVTKRMETLETSNRENIRDMREDNNRRLEEIRGTVNEKLQASLEKTIAESFKAVNDQLEQVYKGLGEMQAIANDVGGLKKVLTGVKTRGILGEIQLGAILEEILSPEQYETNVAVVKGSSYRVEYAVKLPGPNGTVYLPIDSKFPGDRYQQLIDAQESGSREAVDTAFKALEAIIKSEAKDIKEKYIAIPYTTNFAIMFLPFEGLYAEVVNRGMVEVLQRDYHVNIAGPSTMAALLNSLQMGFKTLAIQKRSGEVWKVLGEVKTEFAKFEDGLRRMQGHLNQTSDDLDHLIGTRSRAINKKLSGVSELDDAGPSNPTDPPVFGLK